VTSTLVCDASFFAAAPLVKSDTPTHDRIPPVYFMDTLAGVGFQPVDYVDISETFAVKIEMLRRHVSQLTWLKEYNDVDVLEMIETIARFRGLQCGVRYAEGFQPFEAFGRNLPRRLLP